MAHLNHLKKEFIPAFFNYEDQAIFSQALSMMNTGALRDLLARGIGVSGFIMQNWSRIILLITATIAQIYRLMKSAQRITLALPGQAEQKVITLFNSLRLLKGPSGKDLAFISQLWNGNVVLVLRRLGCSLEQMGQNIKGEVLFWRGTRTQADLVQL